MVICHDLGDMKVQWSTDVVVVVWGGDGDVGIDGETIVLISLSIFDLIALSPDRFLSFTLTIDLFWKIRNYLVEWMVGVTCEANSAYSRIRTGL